MAKKKNDNNDNIRKKLAADGGSQPFRVEKIIIHKDFNSKFRYIVRLLYERYETNPNFYIQRPEFNKIKNILWKDNVWCVNAPIFEYAGNKYAVEEFNLEVKYPEMERLNKIFVFHNFGRNAIGDMIIKGRYV